MLLVTFLIANAALPAPLAANGATDCSEGGFPTNRWQGHYSPGGTGVERHGAKATFDTTALVQCEHPIGVSYDGSFVFSNVTPNNGSDRDIIQTGYGVCRGFITDCNSAKRYFTGYGYDHTTPGCAGSNDRDPIVDGFGDVPSGSHEVGIKHEGNLWKFIRDGQTFYSIPEAAICWQPKRSVFFGESWDYGDQIGGTIADWWRFTETQVMKVEGGNWTPTSFATTTNCNFSDGPLPFQCTVPSAQEIAIFTNER